jgi:hypothetical protein
MTAVKERPYTFSAEMVRSILEGRKTQFCRALEPQPGPDVVEYVRHGDEWLARINTVDEEGVQTVSTMGNVSLRLSCPYGLPGDRLWVREPWRVEKFGYDSRSGIYQNQRIRYEADDLDEKLLHPPASRFGVVWRWPSHMPRAASRLTLEITGVTVTRVWGISEEDALAEGMTPEIDVRLRREYPDLTPSEGFDPSRTFWLYWESLNAKARRHTKTRLEWRLNPWIYAIKFAVVDARPGEDSEAYFCGYQKENYR